MPLLTEDTPSRVMLTDMNRKFVYAFFDTNCYGGDYDTWNTYLMGGEL